MVSPLTPFQILEISKLITHTIDSATSYLKTVEIEKTERQRVVACLTAITRKMEIDRQNFELFMRESFDERERFYKTMDPLIEKGLETNDLELIKFASQVMLNVYNKNPLEGFTDMAQGVKMDLLKPMNKYIED